MRESRVWSWIEKNLPDKVYFERIEVKFPPGLADCFWTDARRLFNITGWLELKYCEPTDPAYRAGRIPKIRPAQPLFLSRQARQGNPSGILLRVGMNTFHVWRATGEREWNAMIQGPSAIANADASWWGSPFPTIEEILQTFTPPL